MPRYKLPIIINFLLSPSNLFHHIFFFIYRLSNIYLFLNWNIWHYYNFYFSLYGLKNIIHNYFLFQNNAF
jgi:hypothetical protein